MSKDLVVLKYKNQKKSLELKSSAFLKEENFSLKWKVNSLTKNLAKFVKGRENLDLILRD